jgi:DNA-binding CsgD family transcriptional regulator
MRPPLKFAIVDSNVLAAIGLKHLLDDIMPIVDIDIYTSFEEMNRSDSSYIHYFISSRIYFEHVAYFRSNPNRPIILVAGDMQISGVTTLNVCQTEQNVAKSILHIMHQGHHGSTKAPTAIISHRDCSTLSPREAEVAVLLSKGMINKEIADKLNISITTVISHRKNIMDKLNARSLADITIYCILNGLIDVAEI